MHPFAVAILSSALPPELLDSPEATIEFLEHTPAETLIVLADESLVEVTKLIDFLLAETQWEGRSQIGCIHFVSELCITVAPIVDSLHDQYVTKWTSLAGVADILPAIT
jgi:hypothetical protein